MSANWDCPGCGRGFAPTDDFDHTPVEGDPSICMACGFLGVYSEAVSRWVLAVGDTRSDLLKQPEIEQMMSRSLEVSLWREADADTIRSVVRGALRLMADSGMSPDQTADAVTIALTGAGFHTHKGR